MEKQRPLLSAYKISKTFTQPIDIEILREITLDIFPGDSLAIMGASGEGKSTLLQILGTLEAPSSGDLWIAGKPVSSHPSSYLRNRHIGFIFQAFNLLEDYSVLQNVLMPALIAGEKIHKGSAAYERACALLEKVGLSHRVHFNSKLLSGGEKQRVAIARAFCMNPEIILADEPSGNLDHENSQIIHNLLMNAVKDLGTCLVVVTHDPALAKLCSRRLMLSCGKLIELANN